MIGVYDVLTWLKRQPVYHELFRYGYCGKLDNKPEKALGVYPLKHGGKPYRAFGGLESFDKVGISLLIHYTRKSTDVGPLEWEALSNGKPTYTPAA